MSQEWALRAADIDIVGHANNAALWQAVSEVAKAPLRSVSVRHHGSVEAMDDVTLVRAPGHLWLSVEGEVRVSADYENLGS
jgi:acyl-ACP thioesterase